MKKTDPDENLIIKTHIVSVLNELRDDLIEKMCTDSGWHDDARKIAISMIIAEIECATKMNYDDLPKEYKKKCMSL